MSGGGAGEKSEKPTEQKKKDAKKEGRVARTPDLGSWGGLFAATILIPMVVTNMMEAAQRLLTACIALIRRPDPAEAVQLFGDGMVEAAMIVAPLAIGMLVLGIAAATVQGGLRVATKLFKPDFKRLNPWQGLKKTFGPHAAWEAVKAAVKTAVLAGVLYWSLADLTPALLAAGTLPLSATIEQVNDAVMTVIRTAALAGVAMAFADYGVVFRRTNKELKMTKQEVKEEHKRQEGDPLLKGAIRQRQMEMTRNRMMADIAKADVVLVNPTHVAVALRYDPAKGAPRVVAKGAGAIATKIREKAAEHRVPMVQDVPLARTLYKACNLGDEIPPELYMAVARVLAFVMTLKARGSAAGMHRSPLVGSAR